MSRQEKLAMNDQPTDQELARSFKTSMMILRALEQVERNARRGQEAKNEKLMEALYGTLDRCDDDDKEQIIIIISQLFLLTLNGVANENNTSTLALLKELHSATQNAL